MKKNNNKGFTLMEMLIVVAIIAILIAIAIPTFSGALEKAREATDMANLRAAYAQIVSDGALKTKTAPTKTANIEYSGYPDTPTATVTATQNTKGSWEGDTPIIGGISVNCGASWEVKYSAGEVTITETAAAG